MFVGKRNAGTEAKFGSYVVVYGTTGRRAEGGREGFLSLFKTKYEARNFMGYLDCPARVYQLSYDRPADRKLRVHEHEEVSL